MLGCMHHDCVKFIYKCCIDYQLLDSQSDLSWRLLTCCKIFSLLDPHCRCGTITHSRKALSPSSKYISLVVLQ